MRGFLLIPGLLICMVSLGQRNIGLPEIFNFSKTGYRAGLQNWSFASYYNEILLVANNEGLLTFNGLDWQLFPLPGKTIVRSVLVKDNRIYVGGQDEFGYFKPNENGVLVFYDLKPSLGPAGGFGDVWQLVDFQDAVFLRTNKYIYQVGNGESKTYATAGTWHFLGDFHDDLFVQDSEKGLLVLKDGKFSPVSATFSFPDYAIICGILPGKNNEALIFTRRHGLFKWQDNQVSAATSSNNWQGDQVYTVKLLDSSSIALGTTNSGLKIIDFNGNVIEHYALQEGLRNENVLALSADRNGNIWLGLDNGIALVGRNNALKLIDPARNGNSGYTARIFKDRLYVGTSNGLYSTPVDPLKDISYEKSAFHRVAHSQGQVWNLSELKGNLYMGHHEGAFLIENDQARLLSPQTGIWNFQQENGSSDLLLGTYEGLKIMSENLNGLRSIAPDFRESSRYVEQDDAGNTWISHPYHGIFRIGPEKTNRKITGPFSKKDGLPSLLNNFVFYINNEVIAATEGGLYRFNAEIGRFGPHPEFMNSIGTKSIRYLHEDQSGKIWFVHEKNLGYLERTTEGYRVIEIPEIQNRLLSGFELVYAYNDRNTFLAGENGIFHLNTSKYNPFQSSRRAYLRSVVMYGNKDSLLFGGFLEGKLKKAPIIPPGSRNITFHFSSPHTATNNQPEFSYRLKNFENHWSEWSTRSEKEYTNLPGGNYVFEVKLRLPSGLESITDSFEFSVKPPWYLTNLAKISYLIFLLSVMYSIYRQQQKKLMRQILSHNEEQRKLKYIHELERDQAEKTFMQLKNQVLEDEIRFKNSQLANNAMHLVQKGELMARMKSNLENLYKKLPSQQGKKEVKSLIKSLDADESFEEDWEQFSQHFDTVHSNFFNILKATYPQLSPNDLKLCAYLRINLNTKEIARMLNISVRGVEISRYRLRKKLNLETSENLNEFLMGIESL